MPLFTYQCDKCGEKDTHLRSEKISEIPIPCEKCGSGMQYKIFDASNTSFELKGKWFKNTGQY